MSGSGWQVHQQLQLSTDMAGERVSNAAEAQRGSECERRVCEGRVWRADRQEWAQEEAVCALAQSFLLGSEGKSE